MRARSKLSAAEVRNLSEPGRYGDGGGLELQVSKWKTKAWIFRYMREGRPRFMGLGAFPDVPLEKARKKATAARQLLADGIDPMADRDAKREAARVADAKRITFKACAAAYIAEHEQTWKSPKHAQQWLSTLKMHVYPKIGDLPVGSIDTSLVLQCLQPIWHKTPETARRVRGRIESVLDWARAHKYRDGENPARLKGHLDHLLARARKSERVRHHPALAFEDLPALMNDLRNRFDVSAKALEFLILTAARTTETIEAKCSEIDFEAQVWNVPAERMKSGRPHVVPLCDRAIEIVRSMPTEEGIDYVFPGGKKGHPLSNMAMLELLRGMRPGLTVHGFRSTFRDWAGDCTNHPRDVIEAALAHVIKNETEAAYRRRTALEKRRGLMRDWEAYCYDQLPMNVIALQRQSA